MGFVWHMIFGYVLLGAGLLHGLVIGALLGGAPSEALFRRARRLAALALAAQLAVVSLSVVSFFAPGQYGRVDPLQQIQTLSYLDGATTVRDF